MSRRRFAGLGLGAGTALIADCTAGAAGSGTDGADGGSPTAGGDGPATAVQGVFRPRISARPVAIDEFDSLEASFDRAGAFRGEDVEPTESSTPTVTTTHTATETPTTETEAGEDDAGDDEADGPGGARTAGRPATRGRSPDTASSGPSGPTRTPRPVPTDTDGAAGRAAA